MGGGGESHLASYESHGSTPPWRKVSSSSLDDEVRRQVQPFENAAAEVEEEGRGKRRQEENQV